MRVLAMAGPFACPEGVQKEPQAGFGIAGGAQVAAAEPQKVPGNLGQL